MQASLLDPEPHVPVSHSNSPGTQKELRAIHRLASWMGPWRKVHELPPDVSVRDAVLDDVMTSQGTPLCARIYTPRDARPIGSYILAHGLNLQGPADVRCDRFARILAHAGFAIMAPVLPQYTQLLVAPTVAQDFTLAARAWLTTWGKAPWTRPGIFGISFGSYPALVTAGNEELADRFGGVVAYGGYADFHRTLRFAIGAQRRNTGKLPIDGTCLPAVYLNLIPQLAPHLSMEEREQVCDAIRRYVSATWGKHDMKEPKRYVPLAQAIAAGLRGAAAEAFCVAAGLVPGGAQLCSDALYHHDPLALDPRPAMNGIRCPVYLLHSADDDVISSNEIEALLQALPTQVKARAYLTGLYDHGGQSGVANALLAGPAVIREAFTMAAMVRAIIRGGIDCGD